MLALLSKIYVADCLTHLDTEGGGKQLSALGEQYVEALPDREAAKSAVARLRRPRLAKRQKSRLSKKEDDGKDLV